MSNARVPLLLATLLALAAAGTVLTPAAQSWIVLRLLRRTLDPQAELGSARIGWDGGVRLRELRLSTPGLGLEIPEAEVRPRWASLLLGGGPEFEQVRLRGCVLQPLGPATAGVAWREQLRTVAAAALIPARLDAEGEIRLPAATGVIRFRAEGAGAGGGPEGGLRVEFGLRPPETGLPAFEGRLRLGLPAGPLTVPLRAELDARVRAEGWPREFKVAGELTEGAAPGGGEWSVRVRALDREVARLSGTLPEAGDAWRVSWWADFREDEVARLVPEPRWTGERIIGEGELRWLPDSGLVAVRGKAEVELGAAARAYPALAPFGLTGGDAEFELRAGARVWAFERLDVRLRAGGPAPVLRLTSRQPWAVDWPARSFQAKDPEADLLGLEVLDFTVPPLRLDGITLGGGPVRGRLVGRVSAGGLALRTDGNLEASAVFVGPEAGRWAESLALTVRGGLRVAPEGWSADVDELRLSGIGGEFAVLEARGGRLAGARESWKVAGRGRVQLAAAAPSLSAGRAFGLTAGVLEVDAGATGGEVMALHAWVRASGLRGTADLPDIRVDARVDREPSGRLKFHVPLESGTGPNSSRVLAVGVLEPVAGGGRLEVEVAGPRLDVASLGRFLPWSAGAVATPVNAAPWAGWSGSLVARIDELVTEAGGPFRDSRARLRLEDHLVHVDQLELTLDGGASLRASGTLRHLPGENAPYSLQSAVVLREWSPGGGEADSGWFSGKLDLAGSLRSRAAQMAGLWAALEGEVHVVSRGGTLRLFPVNLPPAPAGSGRVAEILAAAGGALESLGVRREPPLSRGRSVAELAGTLHPLAFDQLSLVASRDAAGHLSLRHVVVLAPELRLTGGGNLLRRPGAGFLEGSLALELQLRARGRPAELLRGLGALDEVPDEWGYAAAGLPLRVRGTLARPDASDLGVRLAALALERSPVAERAADWLNRIRRTK